MCFFLTLVRCGEYRSQTGIQRKLNFVSVRTIKEGSSPPPSSFPRRPLTGYTQGSDPNSICMEYAPPPARPPRRRHPHDTPPPKTTGCLEDDDDQMSCQQIKDIIIIISSSKRPLHITMQQRCQHSSASARSPSWPPMSRPLLQQAANTWPEKTHLPGNEMQTVVYEARHV
jgi:hypothetical protein